MRDGRSFTWEFRQLMGVEKMTFLEFRHLLKMIERKEKERRVFSKKKKPVFKLINLKIYPWDILYTVGSTEEEVVSYLRDEFNYHMDEEEKNHLDFGKKTGRTVRLKNRSIVMWVKQDSIPVLGHEIFHAVELLFEMIQIPINENTSEAWAYLIEYVWKEVIEAHK